MNGDSVAVTSRLIDKSQLIGRRQQLNRLSLTDLTLSRVPGFFLVLRSRN